MVTNDRVKQNISLTNQLLAHNFQLIYNFSFLIKGDQIPHRNAK